MRKFLPILIGLGLGYLAVEQWGGRPDEHRAEDASSIPRGAEVADSGGTIAEAFQRRQSDVLVQGRGDVVRVLADDRDGSKHQRFILRLDSGQTLLVAHNIDLAPRLPGLKAGDVVEFSGEYEWNDEGGVIHWTHRDPQGRHPGGWLRYRGKTYQ